MIQEKLESCQDTVAKLLVFHPAKEGKSQQENPYTNNYLSGETLLQKHTEHIQKHTNLLL